MAITRICCISDTHGLHDKFTLPDCEIIVHAGDMCNTGRSWSEIVGFNLWLKEQKANIKKNTGYAPVAIVIAGNHDRLFETTEHRDFAKAALADVDFYLEESGCEVHGIKFWGSPYQPEFCNWAFNVPRGAMIRRHWDRIPTDVDVLITHGPPFGVLDTMYAGAKMKLGCEELAEVVKIIKPNLHIFGHIHGGHGVAFNGDTFSVNAAALNEQYTPVHDVTVVAFIGEEKKLFVTSHNLKGHPIKTMVNVDWHKACEDASIQ